MPLNPVFAGLAFAVLITGCTGVRPADLGVKEGKFAPCPSSPNCVSSQSPDAEHAVQPLAYSGPVPDAVAALKTVLLSMKRVRITDESDGYLRAEFTSALFRFVDDAEFYFDRSGTIQVRSASRLGRSDLGVNRKRVEEVRARWNALPK